jgi:hypothetical protein
LRPIKYTEWIELRNYVEKRAEKEGIYLPEGCIAGGCIARILGLSVLPDGTYWDCPRHQKIMGKYPKPIREVLRKPEDTMNPFDTCCRYLGW